VGGSPYFTSGATFVRSAGRLFSTADGSLSPAGAPSPPAPGSDALGAFTRQEMTWLAGGAPLMVTAVSTYAGAGAVVFETTFPAGLNGSASPQGGDATSSGWPTFALDAADADRGVVGWGGRFLEGSHASAWGDAGSNLASAGQHGGPMVLFNKALTVAVAVSSLSAHPVTISAVDRAGAALSYGLLGSVTSAPAGFTLRVIVAATAGGPTAGALRWGGLATTYGGAAGKRLYDNSTKWLGYVLARATPGQKTAGSAHTKNAPNTPSLLLLSLFFFQTDTPPTTARTTCVCAKRAIFCAPAPALSSFSRPASPSPVASSFAVLQNPAGPQHGKGP